MKRAWGDPPALAAWSAAAASSAGEHCRWPYVDCDSTGQVTSLVLIGINNVTGPVPDAVSSLSCLTHLDGSTSPTTTSAARFQWRSSAAARSCTSTFSHNYIGGELPDDIGHGLGSNLSTLDLGVNDFNGSVPVSLSVLRNLQYALDSNSLTGAIPSELGELSNLKTLLLENNPFHAGELPTSFENLTNVARLWATNCSLIGDFPRYLFWGLKKLQRLLVDRNNLTGNLVVHGFAAMSLVVISVADNKLTGMIPEVFGRLENLTHFSLNNNFTGEIPVSIGRLSSLYRLLLFNNRLTGTLPPELTTGNVKFP
ncbi:unnamed protein product [Urochloa humidicola]